MHGARWRERSENGALAQSQLLLFHTDVVRAFYYIGGFYPGAKAYSPGSLILQHAIQEAVLEGCDVFDFLRGDERYKYAWGAVDAPKVRFSQVSSGNV